MGFTTGQVANLLSVDRKTVTNWIDNPSVTRFFSASARQEAGKKHRDLNKDDALLLNTIRVLRNERGESDWTAIAEYLETGKRETSNVFDALPDDTRTISITQAEQSAKASATLAERDAALARVAQLESDIERLRLEYKTDIEAKNAEIARLNREIGRLQGKYEAD